MRILTVFFLLVTASIAFGGGLVAEYKFDGGLIDTGSDGQAADTLTSSSCVYDVSFAGQSLYCSSNNLTASDSADLDLPAQYTIEAFIKPYSFDGTQYIISKNSYAFVIADSNLIFYHTQSDNTIIASSPIPLVLNRWQHIAAIANGGIVMVFLNGRAAATIPYNGTILNSASPLSIGANAGSNPYYGLIDEIRIFNEVKTPAYIYSRALYTCGAMQNEDVDGDCRITFDDFEIMSIQWLLSEN
ncbi:MAG: LamG domain-containing protein [Phycisphaerales bacterium]